jgi:hypothetical protein
VATWVCKACTAVFAVGAPRCPVIECRARDAYEQGDETRSNVYDLPEWQPVQQVPDPRAEVDERLGLLPDETVELDAELDGTGQQLPPAEDHVGVELAGEGIRRPLITDPKSEWVVFAHAINDRDPEKAQVAGDPGRLTKSELVELYGDLGEG